jgi:hypothetical protein
MPLLSRLKSAYRKLRGRPPYDPEKYADARTRDIDSLVASTSGDAERDFKKPKP